MLGYQLFVGVVGMSRELDQRYRPHTRSFLVDSTSMVQWRGQHRDIPYSISEHGFKAESSPWGGCPTTWCTYVYLTEEMHEQVKHRINDAPWNGGQTYYRKETQDFVDMPADSDLRQKWGRPIYKVGDDFNHIWDDERYEYYSLEYMEKHIKGVIDYLLAALAKGE